MKDTIKRIKTSHKLEVNFANIALIKGLYPPYVNNSQNSIIRKHATQLKMGRDLNRHIKKEDIQMANKHKQRCLTSVVTRDIQINAIRR